MKAIGKIFLSLFISALLIKHIQTYSLWIESTNDHYSLDQISNVDLVKIKNDLSNIFKQYSNHTTKYQLNVKNPHRYKTAYVQSRNHLPYAEQEFRDKRLPIIQQALNKILGHAYQKPLTIAFASSGGGYRAAIATMGFLKGCEDIGLLDSFMYIASLSGSTWFVAPWIYSRLSVNNYKNEFLNKIRNNTVDLTWIFKRLFWDNLEEIINNFWQKFIFDQHLSCVDLYGAFLSAFFLSDYWPSQKKYLSEQLQCIQDGYRPYPLYTAISMYKNEEDNYEYNWYEFNPVEIRNLDLNYYIPTWSFDCIFENGSLRESAPEQTMGYLMGIFGSAYAVNFLDLNRIFYQEVANIPPWSSPLERIKYEVCQKLVILISNIPLIGKKRFCPAQINNPFYNLQDSTISPWLQNRKKITFVDAGIAYNLPGKPLLCTQRNVDVIIFADSSTNIFDRKELHKFFDDAYKTYGYRYTRIDNQDNMTIGFYQDLVHSQAPAIIYINFINDKNLLLAAGNDTELVDLICAHHLETFDASVCIQKEYCSTFNFSYSSFEFMQLSAMAEFNVKINKNAIVQFLINNANQATNS